MPRPGSHTIHPDALAVGRSASEAGMTDTVEVREPDAVSAFDSSDPGAQSTSDGTVVYSGRGRIHPVRLNEREVKAADEMVALSRWHLRLPIEDSDGNQTSAPYDHVVEVTAVDTARSDPALIGRRFRIVDQAPRAFGTELRVTLREEGVP